MTTRIARRFAAADARAALGEGDTVEVYVDGPVALSCPPQGRASAIVLVAEAPIGKGDVREFEQLVATLPDWADGLPIEAEGWNGPRYRK